MKRAVAILIVPISIISVIFASSCDREFNLYDNYGPGYEITCKGLDETSRPLLEHFTVANEISLQIHNSTFLNVTSSVFRRVGSIRYLYLENSTFTFPESESIFGVLENLEYLSISSTLFSINKHTFSNLKSLKNLILNNNGIKHFSEDCFKDLVTLNNLQITKNGLRDMDNIPFCTLDKLRQLNLSNNGIQNLSSEYLICGNDDDIMISLDVNDQKVSIEPDNFSTIDAFSSDLNDLDLSFNHLKTLGYYLNSFRYIRKLNLQGNQLTKIKKSNFRNLNNSEVINLSNNHIKSIENNTFLGKDDLVKLDLSNNKLNRLIIDDLSTLRYLNLGYNNLTESCLISRSIIQIEVLLLNNNNLSDIRPNIFVKFENLKTLDISNNHIKLNNDSFKGLSQLEILKMNNNGIEKLPSLVFWALNNLENLDLSQNKLSSFPNENIFRGLENLVNLNISHNHIENLEYRLLENTKDLRVLDLEDNHLHYIQYEMIMSRLPLLSVLNIRSNLLSCENLANIIKYLKDKGVNYTTQHSFDTDEENIAGIYCKSDRMITSQNSLDNSQSGSSYILTLSIVAVTISLVIIAGLFIFKIYIFVKRRRYRADEFELIDE